MNSNIVAIGVKVLVAVISGVAVFVGIGKMSENYNASQNTESGGTRREGDIVKRDKPNFGDTLVDSLVTSRNTCSKVTSVIGSLSSLAENTRDLFRGDNNNNRRYDNRYCGGDDNVRFIRRSPFIIEAVGNSRNGIYNDNLDGHYF